MLIAGVRQRRNRPFQMSCSVQQVDGLRERVLEKVFNKVFSIYYYYYYYY